MQQQRRHGVRRHRRIGIRLWLDHRFCSLSRPEANGQSLYWFLRAGPYTGIIPGLFAARAPGLADHLGWSSEAFREAFTEVAAAGLVSADWVAGVVFVPDAVLDEPPQSPNVILSWKNPWAEIPECELKDEAYQYLLSFTEGISKAYVEAFVKACVKPSHVKPSANQETRDKKQEQEHTRPEVARESKKQPAKGDGVDAGRVAQRRAGAKKRRKGKSGGARTVPPNTPSDPSLFSLPREARRDLMQRLDPKTRKQAQVEERRGLLDKIRGEVIRVYLSRRKEALGDDYLGDRPRAMKAAEALGVACIGYGVTPEQMIDYWRENDFTDQKFPSLPFIAGGANMDRAACSLMPARGGTANAQSKGTTRAASNEDWGGGEDDNEQILGRNPSGG